MSQYVQDGRGRGAGANCGGRVFSKRVLERHADLHTVGRALARPLAAIYLHTDAPPGARNPPLMAKAASLSQPGRPSRTTTVLPPRPAWWLLQCEDDAASSGVCRLQLLTSRLSRVPSWQVSRTSTATGGRGVAEPQASKSSSDHMAASRPRPLDHRHPAYCPRPHRADLEAPGRQGDWGEGGCRPDARRIHSDRDGLAVDTVRHHADTMSARWRPLSSRGSRRRARCGSAI